MKRTTSATDLKRMAALNAENARLKKRPKPIDIDVYADVYGRLRSGR
jgi:hypothetical protein